MDLFVLVQQQSAVTLMEPDYLAQNGDPMTPQEARTWMETRATEAKAMGCRHGRYSYEPDHKIYLVEGWRVRPEKDGSLCEGEPRFQFQAAKSEGRT